MGETEEDGAKPLRQPKKDGSQKPIRQAENEIPVFALFAILANMDPRTMSELIAKKKGKEKHNSIEVYSPFFNLASMFLRRFLWVEAFLQTILVRVVTQGYGSNNLSQSTCNETAEPGTKTGFTLRLLRCTAKTCRGQDW